MEIGKRAYGIYARVDYVSEIGRVHFLYKNNEHLNTVKSAPYVVLCLLQATRRARNPNLHIVITHALHVCSQHSFGLPLRMDGMHRTQFGLSITRNLVTRVLTICHVKLPQSTTMEQNRFDL